jgi:hypothetical protein
LLVTAPQSLGSGRCGCGDSRVTTLDAGPGAPRHHAGVPGVPARGPHPASTSPGKTPAQGRFFHNFPNFFPNHVWLLGPICLAFYKIKPGVAIARPSSLAAPPPPRVEAQRAGLCLNSAPPTAANCACAPTPFWTLFARGPYPACPARRLPEVDAPPRKRGVCGSSSRAAYGAAWAEGQERAGLSPWLGVRTCLMPS